MRDFHDLRDLGYEVGVDVGADAREGEGAAETEGEEHGFASCAAVQDGGCYVDDILCGKATVFCEFGIDDGVHLKRCCILLPEVRIFSARSVRGPGAQWESGFLCVMAGVFVCDG